MTWLAALNGNGVWSVSGALLMPPSWFSLSRWPGRSFCRRKLSPQAFVRFRTERTIETGANEARGLRGGGNRERSEHGFNRPLGAPPYRFGQNAAICLAGCWNRWKQPGQSKSRISTLPSRLVRWRLFRLRYGRFLDGSLSAASAISASSFWNSLNPAQGMMMLLLTLPLSSMMRRKRPRGFSLSKKTKLLRSTCTCSDFKVSSWMCGRNGR